MWDIIYLVGVFFTAFFAWKKWGDVIKYKLDNEITIASDVREFWYLLLTSVAWFIAIPTIFLWNMLDKLYNKFNRKENEKEMD